MTNELVLTTEDLIENPTPRVPVVLCLDTSASMIGAPIRELNKGVDLFYDSILSDEVARYSAEIGIVTFGRGGVQRIADFGPVEHNPGNILKADGSTPMGAAVCEALRMLDDRKSQYQDMGIDYYQPWLILMTDGGATDSIDEATSRVVDMIRHRKLTIFPIGIGSGADMNTLHQFSPHRDPLRLKGLEFERFFEWLSASVQRVSASTPGEDIPLDMEGIKGWGTL